MLRRCCRVMQHASYRPSVPQSPAVRNLSTITCETGTQSPPPARQPFYSIPSPAAYCALYRRLLHSSALFRDDVIRFGLRELITSTFRAHRGKHRAMHLKQQQRAEDQEAAQRWVKDRIRAIVAAQPPPSVPPARTTAPPRDADVRSVSLLPASTNVSHALRRLLHERFRTGERFLRLLELAHGGYHPARVRVLSLAYGLAGPQAERMQTWHRRAIADPHWAAQQRSRLHPLQRAALDMGSGGGDSPCGLDWVEAYRALILERCASTGDWQRCYRVMLGVPHMPQKDDRNHPMSGKRSVKYFADARSDADATVLPHWVEAAQSTHPRATVTRSEPIASSSIPVT